MKPLPSDLQSILNLTEQKALAGLKDFDPAGADEAAAAVKQFATRGKEIVTAFALGKMDATATARAIESERHALTFTLAAIAHENKRDWLAQLLHLGLKFITSLLTPAK